MWEKFVGKSDETVTEKELEEAANNNNIEISDELDRKVEQGKYVEARDLLAKVCDYIVVDYKNREEQLLESTREAIILSKDTRLIRVLVVKIGSKFDLNQRINLHIAAHLTEDSKVIAMLQREMPITHDELTEYYSELIVPSVNFVGFGKYDFADVEAVKDYFMLTELNRLALKDARNVDDIIEVEKMFNIEPNRIGTNSLHVFAGIGIGRTIHTRRSFVQNIKSGRYDLNQKDDQGRSLFHLLENPPVKVLKALLKNGFDPNNKDSSGRAPLHLMCEVGDVDNIKLLLEYNADCAAQDDNGATPLTIAKSKGLEGYQVLKLLQDHMKKLEAKVAPDPVVSDPMVAGKEEMVELG